MKPETPTPAPAARAAPTELAQALREALSLVDEVTHGGTSFPWGCGTHRVVAWQERARAALRAETKENDRHE